MSLTELGWKERRVGRGLGKALIPTGDRTELCILVCSSICLRQMLRSGKGRIRTRRIPIKNVDQEAKG